MPQINGNMEVWQWAPHIRENPVASLQKTIIEGDVLDELTILGGQNDMGHLLVRMRYNPANTVEADTLAEQWAIENTAAVYTTNGTVLLYDYRV